MRDAPKPRRKPAPSSEAGCYLGVSPFGGRGVFAARPFAPGETILVFRGPSRSLAEVEDFTYCLEVAPGRFLGPSGGIDDFVNHACDPNCGVFIEEGKATLRALCPVAAGEHLTFDYSTVMVRDGTRFPCACGSPRCRGAIGPYAALSREVRRRYRTLGAVPAFVLAAGETGADRPD